MDILPKDVWDTVITYIPETSRFILQHTSKYFTFIDAPVHIHGITTIDLVDYYKVPIEDKDVYRRVLGGPQSSNLYFKLRRRKQKFRGKNTFAARDPACIRYLTQEGIHDTLTKAINEFNFPMLKVLSKEPLQACPIYNRQICYGLVGKFVKDIVLLPVYLEAAVMAGRFDVVNRYKINSRICKRTLIQQSSLPSSLTHPWASIPFLTGPTPNRVYACALMWLPILYKDHHERFWKEIQDVARLRLRPNIGTTISDYMNAIPYSPMVLSGNPIMIETDKQYKEVFIKGGINIATLCRVKWQRLSPEAIRHIINTDSIKLYKCYPTLTEVSLMEPASIKAVVPLIGSKSLRNIINKLI